MKAKHQRLILAAVALCGVGGAGVLAASALRDEAKWAKQCGWAEWWRPAASDISPTA
jgi:Flp pilus assembly protein CpaB